VGGVNYADEPYNLGNGEARDLLNVVATGRGGITKRSGAATAATTVQSGFDSLGLLELPGSSFIVGAGGNSFFSVNSSGGVSNLNADATPGRAWDFVQAPRTGSIGPLYASNGYDTPQSWAGSGAMSPWTGTGIPNARFLLYKGTRVWAFNMPGGYTPTGGAALEDPRSAVVWSDLGDPGSFPAANVNLFNPNDGEEITGAGVIGDYILVFKRSRTFLIYDLDTGANRVLSEGVGCASHRSIARGREGTYFLTNAREVAVCDGSRIQTISDRVAPLLRQIPAAVRDLASGVYFDGRYYLSFSTGTVDRTLDYDTRLNAWFVHSYAPRDWIVWAPDGQPTLYASRPGTIERPFAPGATTDGTSTFVAYWRGPFHTFNQSFVNKRVRRVSFDGEGLIKVSLATDFRDAYSLEGSFDFQPSAAPEFWGTGGASWGEGVGAWASSTDAAEVGVAEVLTPGVARAWSVEFGNDTADSFTVDSYTFFINFRKDRSTA
jgi:hypothetical protein